MRVEKMSYLRTVNKQVQVKVDVPKDVWGIVLGDEGKPVKALTDSPERATIVRPKRSPGRLSTSSRRGSKRQGSPASTPMIPGRSIGNGMTGGRPTGMSGWRRSCRNISAR